MEKKIVAVSADSEAFGRWHELPMHFWLPELVIVFEAADS